MSSRRWLNEKRNVTGWHNCAIRLGLIQKQPKTQGQAEAMLGYEQKPNKEPPLS
jgi:hypothetical protein